MTKVITGKGKSQVGKMDVIVAESHLDARIKSCILMSIFVPKLQIEYE